MNFPLGGLLVFALNTQQPLVSPSHFVATGRELTQASDLAQKRMARGQDDSGSPGGQLAGTAAWQRLTMLSGLTAVTGPGVVVTLDDSRQAANRNSTHSTLPLDDGFKQISAVIIHDVDVLRVVNELFASGAEAVSVNNQRIGPGSFIRAVGPMIYVNQRPYAAPFKIQAIGDPAALQLAMNLPGGVVWELKAVSCVCTVKPSRVLSLPAFDARIDFERAHPVQPEGSAAWQRLTMLSGVTAVTGPGIVVTLSDSPRAANQKRSGRIDSEVQLVSADTIHDVDVLRVVNELFVSGAEAVSVNGHRIGAGSSIRCVGPVINVNHVPCAAPFKIQAIGDPAVLRPALTMPGGVLAELKGLGCVVSVVQQPVLYLLALHATIDFKLARPVEALAKEKSEVQP